MMSDEMIERVASVIAPHLRISVSPNPDCDDQNAAHDFALQVARAAIEATTVKGDGLVERLGYHWEHPVTGKLVLRNPDTPEAADTITTLKGEIERLRNEGLALADFIADLAEGDTMVMADTLLAEAKRARQALGSTDNVG